MSTRHPIFSAFRHAGFSFHTWEHQKFVDQVFGERAVSKTFVRGTIDGLAEFDFDNAIVSLIAICNSKRGNGEFLATIEQFERITAAHSFGLRVVQFFNPHLAAWFERRAGWTLGNDKEHGAHATFTAPVAASTAPLTSNR